MRGKLGDIGGCNIKNRITPADAGKTIFVSRDIDESWDHPRGCGENLGFPSLLLIVRGSPPRMRGKLSRVNIRFAPLGITPADAGKTHHQFPIHRECQDHPRGCGENEVTFPFASYVIGSPPRMRGKRKNEPIYVNGLRITPADAGKTFCTAAVKTCAQDHPRGCGENFIRDIRQQGIVGSPPRMRGKLCFERGGKCPAGITPADAGKTLRACNGRRG